MASVIKIKTAQTTASPNETLNRGELAFTYANNRLWVGNLAGPGNPEIQIAGEVTANSADITTSSIKIPTGKAVFDYVAGATTSVGSITGLGAGVSTFLTTPTSANLKTAVTDETGSGSLVFATSPTLITPILGTPASGNLTNCTFPTLNQNTTGSAGSLSLGDRTITFDGILDAWNLNEGGVVGSGMMIGSTFLAGNPFGVNCTVDSTGFSGVGTNITDLNASNISAGTLNAARLPAFTGDASASVGTGSLTVTKINGVSLAGLATGILKNTTATGVPSIAVAGTDYLTPSGSGASLTGVTLSSIVPNTAPAAGRILVGNAGGTAYAPVDVSGDVTITSAGVTAIGALKVTNAMLAGSIAASKLIGTDIATVGTVNAGTWNATTIGVNKGGTGQTSYAVGDILQATGATTLSKLAAVATGNVLISGGVTTASSWGKVGLTTHVSGTLPIANGGTGGTTAQLARFGLGSIGYDTKTTNFTAVIGVEHLAIGPLTVTAPTTRADGSALVNGDRFVVHCAGGTITYDGTGYTVYGTVITATRVGGSWVTSTGAVALQSPVNIALGGDLSGSASFDGSADITINATIGANSVALGTDTTGNYVATVTGTANQVTVSGSGSETAAVTLSLPQNIHTAATPTFAGATLGLVTAGLSAGTVTTTSGGLTLNSAAGTVTVDDNLTVVGNLVVQGTTTTVNSSVVSINDPIFVLGDNSVVDTYDRGIAFEYKESTTNYEGFFGWDRSNDTFTFRRPGTAGDEVDGVVSGTIGSAYFDRVYYGNTDAKGATSIYTDGTGFVLETPSAMNLLAGGNIVFSTSGNTHVTTTGQLFVGNVSTPANTTVYGNVVGTSPTSAINGFIIDGGTF